MTELHPEAEALMQAAEAAFVHAYAPYSRFYVGAAVLAENAAGAEKVFTGCNVENAAYSLSLCAERNALSSAIAAGYTRMRAIAIASATARPCFPCGACRQWLWELGQEMDVWLRTDSGALQQLSPADFLPYAFAVEALQAPEHSTDVANLP